MSDKKEINWEEMHIGDQVQIVCSIADARVYLQVSEPGLQKILNREKITRYERGFGSKKYVKRQDLDKLLEGRPAMD